MSKLLSLIIVSWATLLLAAPVRAASNKVDVQQDLVILDDATRTGLLRVSNTSNEIAYLDTHVVEVTYDDNDKEILTLVEGAQKKNGVIVIPDKGIVPPKTSVMYRVLYTGDTIVGDRYFKVRFVPVISHEPNKKNIGLSEIKSGVFISLASSGYVAVKSNDGKPLLNSRWIPGKGVEIKNVGTSIGLLNNCQLCDSNGINCMTTNQLRVRPNTSKMISVESVESVVFRCVDDEKINIR